MKLLLTGATGYIGGEILKQCIAHSYVHHIYILARRPVDAKFAQHKKVTQILHEDFEQYPVHLLERLQEEGVEACIWALGGKVQDFANLDEARKVGVSFPIQAAEAFSKHLAPALEPWAGFPEKKLPSSMKKRFPFRFVFVSGWGAEHDQFRTLWMYSDSRKIKGAAEKGLFEVADNSEEKEVPALPVKPPPLQRAASSSASAASFTPAPSTPVAASPETQAEEAPKKVRCFEVIALRPGGVIAGGDSITTLMSEATMPCIAVDRLAKCAIRVALNGSGGRRTLENKDCLGDDWAMVNSFSF